MKATNLGPSNLVWERFWKAHEPLYIVALLCVFVHTFYFLLGGFMALYQVLKRLVICKKLRGPEYNTPTAKGVRARRSC